MLHIDVVLNEHEDAMRELERAVERIIPRHCISIGIAPEFAPLRSDKRCVSIVERIGLEPEKVFASAG